MSDTNHHVLTGKVDITSNLLVGSSHLFVDTENNRVGLVTANPQAGLHVNSNAYVNTDLRVGPAGPNQVVINATAGRIKAASFEGDGSLLENIPPGADGAAATIAVGTTTTGAAGSSASVTNSGTTSAAVFDFVIPRGDQGIQGIPGNDGADGADGAPGADGTDGTNYFTLSGSNIYRDAGNVGISTTTPMTKLDIAYNAAAPAIVFSDTTNSRYQTGIGSLRVSDEGQRLDFYTGDSLTNGTLLTNTPRMCITGIGNVGINTTSPASGLHVRNPGGADVASSITIQPASTQYARGHAKIEAYPDATVGAGTGLKFYTRADSGTDFDPTSLVTARMTIKENGNVGVGSTSPTGRLEVEYTEGTLSSYSYATSSTWHNKGLALKGGNAGFLYGHDINHSIFLRQSPFGSTDHNAYCNVGYHAFYTGGHIQVQTEKMRIASDGKINHAHTEKYNFHHNPNQWGYGMTNSAYNTEVDLWDFTLNVPYDGWIFVKCHAHWTRFNSSTYTHSGGNQAFYGWVSVEGRSPDLAANYDSHSGASNYAYDKFHSYNAPTASAAGTWRDFNHAGFYKVSAGNNTVSLRVNSYFSGGANDYLLIYGSGISGFYMPRNYL